MRNSLYLSLARQTLNSCRTSRTIYAIDLSESSARNVVTSPPLNSADFQEIFWISNDTIGFTKNDELQSIPLPSHPERLLDLKKGTRLVDLPPGINASAFVAKGDAIYFTAEVWEKDEDFHSTKTNDDEYASRKTSALVFDSLPVRQWDSWVTPGKTWTLGKANIKDKEVTNLLKGKGLVGDADLFAVYN